MRAVFEIVSRPRILTSTLAIFVVGGAISATAPYQSLIGVGVFQMPEAAYAALVLLASLSSMCVSIGLGILSDYSSNRLQILCTAVVACALGYGVFALFPSPALFVACLLLLIPISNATYSMLFAAVRAETQTMDRATATSITAAVRSVFAGAWVVIPSIVAALIGSQATNTWGFAAVCFLVCSALVIILRGKSSSRSSKDGTRRGPLEALRMVRSWPVLSKVLIVALIIGPHRFSGLILPLIVTRSLGGTLADVGIVVASVATLEIPFMLIWGAVTKHLSSTAILCVGGLLFAAYLVGLSLATSPLHVMVLVILNAAGASALIVMPITLFQELMPDHPGTGTALVSMVSVAAHAVSASVFALCSLGVSYSSATLVAGGVGVAGVFALRAMGGRRASQSKEVVNVDA